MLHPASASPTPPKELLRNAGLDFLVQPANVVEAISAGEAPETCAERLARSKAYAVLTSGHSSNLSIPAGPGR